jgi:hypothetical protein
MALIKYPRETFSNFYNSPADKIEEELSRASIRLKLSETPKTPEERMAYQDELDKLTVLKYISRLKKAKLSLEEFYSKVELTVK